MTSDRGLGSTYRVQLHAGFDFTAAAGIVDYLEALGVTHLYCSPVLQAAPGSTHGYDVVDPRRLSAALGGAPGYARLLGALHDHELGQILDIVPNHMAADATNQWWWDVLESGAASRYAHFFDIDWSGPVDKAAFTVLAPVLGDHYGRVLEAGELRVERIEHRFTVTYADHSFPISPRTLDDVFAAAARRAGSPALAALAIELGELTASRITDTDAIRDRHARTVELQAELLRLCSADGTVGRAIDAEIAALNDDVDRLDALLVQQNYRLAHWRTASEELDYRRFFTIAGLVGVRVEDPDVFAETHGLVIDLVLEGSVDGLRVDHVDGMRQPAQYLSRLADATGGAYTVVEKILEPGEVLAPGWPVRGTSGYDFLNRVNALFVASANESAMTEIYRSFSGEQRSYAEIAHESKLHVMRDDLAAETARVTELLAYECDRRRRHRDHTRRALRDTVQEFVAAFPVYRTYVEPGGSPSASDLARLEEVAAATLDNRPDLDPELVDLIRDLASGHERGHVPDEFALRLQQLTSPVMAKGVEDTAFYRYNRLVSLNEVGGDPATFGSSADAFHAATAHNAAQWPDAMLTLSTHDTKRSADVRARINVLSEVPEAWRRATDRWAERNQRHRIDSMPDRNDEYLLYQTLVGAWPIGVERVAAFMAKATREAKLHTSWTDPAPDYDDAVDAFVRSVLADATFRADLEHFLHVERIVERGRRNSLAQTALLLTCPGVPDLYQGTELWDLSLVDPDNRRPVDYDARRQALARSIAESDPAPVDLSNDSVGASKLRLVHGLLRRRAEAVGLASSRYEPLEVVGERCDQIVAFERSAVAVVIPVRGDDCWRGTDVVLSRGRWTDLLTGATTAGGRVGAGRLLSRFPVAVLARDGEIEGAI